ncbi:MULTISPECIES: ComEA family DNA-binding protein [unclassified Nitrobacter]|jgi:DNA uptake protein ComE-like DNA-binding protein|uniref:ComEA family DNA-binding protein n=1 Tax=unclassified Nitrobacter TaxID=2620411 RepID=UPI00092A93B9|nr:MULTISPECIES: helix-hairpin-helix domain-containing protein [unclassified Nitrobacter]MBN9148916.1 helix-hairpin-helix domain-containing protein [Nitrobacter sp.]OJV03373.1 MAG: DNA-binding protein [Nitrobacter sp. 62-23]
MRHFTLASITAAALALGLLVSTPSMAQSTQPAAKSDRMAPAGKMAPANKMAPPNAEAAKLDINTATKEELMAFKGIGDKYSDKIIAGRPYAKKDQLVSKKILPEATYKKISGQIIASQPK